MMRSVAAPVLAAALLVLGTVPAAAAPPSGPACGDTISGEVRLRHDLVCTTVGLVLAPGAVLDLDGHTLRGPGPVAGWALRTDVEGTVPGEAPVTLRDGRVLGWAQVLGAGSGVLDVVVRDVRFTHNGTVMSGEQVHADVDGSRFADNATAITGHGGVVEVRDSTFVRNAVAALALGPDHPSSHTLGPGHPSIRVTGSTFADNGLALGCSGGAVAVDSSTLRRNDAGISSSRCETTLTGSTLADNGVGVRTRTVGPAPEGLVDPGLVDTGLVDTGLVDTVGGNLFVRNGIGADLAVAATVADNTFLRNGGDGIRAPQAVDLGGNTARGNGTDPPCVGVVCTPRP